MNYQKIFLNKFNLIEDIKEGNISVAKKKYQKIWQL